MNRKAIVTAGVAALVVTLAACEGAEPTKPVEGLRDDLKYLAPIYVTTHQPVTRRDCTTTVETRTTFVNGKATTKTVPVTKCKDVNTGQTRQVTTMTKQPKWCVELDNVNGDQSADDQWYRVDQGTHQLASETTEGKSIKFTPIGQGC